MSGNTEETPEICKVIKVIQPKSYSVDATLPLPLWPSVALTVQIDSGRVSSWLSVDSVEFLDLCCEKEKKRGEERERKGKNLGREKQK